MHIAYLYIDAIVPCSRVPYDDSLDRSTDSVAENRFKSIPMPYKQSTRKIDNKLIMSDEQLSHRKRILHVSTIYGI